MRAHPSASPAFRGRIPAKLAGSEFRVAGSGLKPVFAPPGFLDEKLSQKPTKPRNHTENTDKTRSLN